jgi:hypothetical protein
MDNLLNELDVEKLARALPDGPDRDQAIVNAIQLRLFAERAIAAAGEGDDTGVELMRGGSGGAGSGGGKGGRR